MQKTATKTIIGRAPSIKTGYTCSNCSQFWRWSTNLKLIYKILSKIKKGKLSGNTYIFFKIRSTSAIQRTFPMYKWTILCNLLTKIYNKEIKEIPFLSITRKLETEYSRLFNNIIFNTLSGSVTSTRSRSIR